MRNPRRQDLHVQTGQRRGNLHLARRGGGVVTFSSVNVLLPRQMAAWLLVSVVLLGL